MLLFSLLERFISPLAHYLPLLLDFSSLPVLVHLQDSHYILYRGINATRNPELALPRMFKRETIMNKSQVKSSCTIRHGAQKSERRNS